MARLALLAPCLIGEGCGAGTAAIASAGGSSGGSSNGPTQIVGVRVESARVSPAEIHFHLVDPESDPAAVEVRYSTDGTFENSVLLATLAGATTAPGAGVEHEVAWDFEPSFGAGLSAGVLALVVLAGHSNVDLGVNASFTSLGNDPPQAEIVPGQFPDPPGEVSGILPVDFVVADSSGDDVKVLIEYGVPSPSGTEWDVARPAGLAAGAKTPPYAFESVTAFQSGSQLTFAWDSNYNLDEEDVAVRLRIRAEELEEPKASSPFSSTKEFRVDNNQPPEIGLNVLAFALNPDARRGIPLPFSVDDPEGDEVQVLLQWKTPSGTFPDLPSDPSELGALLESEELRRQKQIATEAPRAFGGRVLEVVGSNIIRLPELASSAAPLLSRSPDPAKSLQGRALELLRRSRELAPASPTWGGATPLVRPAALLATAGHELFVLDEPSVGQWRLRALDPATGAVGEPIGGVQPGTPTALARVPGYSALVVASHVSNAWRLTRVELATGAMQTLFTASSPLELGSVRGLAVLRAERSLVSVGDALICVDHPPAAQSTARPLFDPSALPPALLAPHGLAPDPLDPKRVYVAENGRDRVVELDLADLSITPLRAGGVGLLRPTDLAFDASGRRLYVVTDEVPSNATRELWALKLGLRSDVAGASQIERLRIAGALPVTAKGLATGPSALLACVDPEPGELYVGGGVEQMRKIESYDPQRQLVTVDAPFQPAVQISDPWRIVDSVANAADAVVLQGGVFVWDASDVAGTTDVELRAVAFDADPGPYTSSAVKSLLGALDSEPVVAAVCCPPSAATDLEGDGDIDFAAAQASLLLAAPLQYEAVANAIPAPEVLADLNQDGAQDLAVGGSIYYQVPGSPGSYQAGQAIAPSGFSDCGDVDRDGRLDLLRADGAIHYQPSPGVFGSGPGVSFAGLFLATEPKLGDADGDGDLDVCVVAEEQGSNHYWVAIFAQVEQGGFSAQPTQVGLPLFWGDSFLPGVTDFIARDIDLDGRSDFLLALYEQPWEFKTGPACTWFSSSDAWTLIDPPLGTQETNDLVLADLDGNGLEDLVARQSTQVSIYYQRAPAQLAVEDSRPLASPPSGARLYAGDLDGDGLLDLAPNSAQGASLHLAVSRSPGGFRDFDPIALAGPAGGYDEPAVGDFDHDGDLDVVAPFQTPVALTHLFLQVRPGEFEPQPTTLVHPFDQSYHSARAADLDGDGKIDVALAGKTSDAGMFAVFIQGQGKLNPSGGGEHGNQVVQLELADLDGDGPMDVVLRPLGIFSGSSRIELHTWGSSPTKKGELGDSEGGRFCIVDLDGDGDYDVLEETQLGLALNEQISREPLAFSASLVAPGAGPPLLAEDLDRDGRVDFVTGGSELDVYLAQAGGGYALSQTLPISAAVAHAVDVDGDAFLDLIVQDGGGTRTLIQILPGVLVENARLAEPGLVAELFADVDGDGELDAVSTPLEELRVQFGGR